jgi:peptidoglycan hydrolase-like protein with peptidoglycan-binding domain
VRCGLVLCVALLVAAPAADGARLDVSVQATPTDGAAPLTVTFTASQSVHWDFGDGQQSDGPKTTHVYAAGRWHASWTSAAGSGGVDITARGVAASSSTQVRYNRIAVFRGNVIPAENGVGVRVVTPAKTVATKTRADGTFLARVRVTRAGAWHAETDVARSDDARVIVVPKLTTTLVGGGARGSRYLFVANVLPRGVGQLELQITRNGTTTVDKTYALPVRIKLDTRRLVTYTIRARLVPVDGYTAVSHVLRASVVLPRLAYGSRSSTVAQLAARLRALHYAAPATATFDGRLLDAVYAFEKVQGLPRTGTVTAAFWQRLGNPRTPVPRYAQPSSHLEVNKTRQVLYVVRHSRVALIVPVSTAGLPGKFTPTGRFSIYRKVGGFDPSPLGTLYDPMYFTGGYAIHGNPSVPPYPASHGCVRVPMWVAPILYATNPYGETVYVY